MKSIAFPSAIIAALAAIGVAHAAEITIYKQPNFTGDQTTVRDARTDLAGSGFKDQASSVVIQSGRWQLCTWPDFKGDCMTLTPGEYARLDEKIFHRVRSIRPLDTYAENDRGYYGRDRAYGYGERQRGADIELFAGRGYRGPHIGLDNDRGALGYDRDGVGVSSVVVNDGTWQLCSRPGFRGDCDTYEPGSYPDVGRMSRIASARRVG